MRVAFVTLGCKVNQYDTQSLTGAFQQRGYEIVTPESAAEIYVINTCVVTGVGAGKSRQLIRKAIKANPSAIIVVVGCYAQTAPEEIAEIAGVNIIVGMADRDRVVNLVEEYCRNQCNLVQVQPVETQWLDLKSGAALERTRAMLKVEEGCDEYCSYCIVPYARGRVRSLPLEKAILEFNKLIDYGYKEIVLTGIHLGAYGRDLGINLIDLIKELIKQNGGFRIRLGSLEPLDFQGELIDLILNNPKVCQHFHIPLQSGSDHILKLMNRKYDKAYYRHLLADLRAKNPLVAIGTDLIVGFPGEDARKFEEARQFVEEQSFSGIHVFRFSPRRGTAAAELPDQVDKTEKMERSKIIQTLALESRQAFARKFIGQQVQVLFEKETKQAWSGLTGEYLRVKVTSNKSLANLLAEVKITNATREPLNGELIS